jgi:L-fucose mutarotase/ribose pyranase (RbsD/FucU family)
MPKIILLVGRKGSGKDTLASLLLPHCGPTSPRLLSFASPIKETLATLFAFPDLSYFNDQDKKERVWSDYCATHSPRDLMVWFGTDVIRKTFGASFWVDRLKTKVRKMGADDTVIVTDARFPNEVLAMVDEFGTDVTAVYIDACDRIGELDKATAAAPELAVIETRDLLISMEDSTAFNVHMVDNNGTLEQLTAAAAKLGT